MYKIASTSSMGGGRDSPQIFLSEGDVFLRPRIPNRYDVFIENCLKNILFIAKKSIWPLIGIKTWGHP